jgi:hypothetical protein
MPAEEADCILAALGLLHMRVKCVIPGELGGNCQPAMNTCVAGAFEAVLH